MGGIREGRGMGRRGGRGRGRRGVRWRGGEMGIEGGEKEGGWG